MQPFIFAAVFQLCLILDILTAASNKKEFTPEEERISFVVDGDAVLTLIQGGFRRQRKPFKKSYKVEASTGLLKRPQPTFHQYYLLHDWQGRKTDKWINDTKAAVVKHPKSAILRFGWAKEAAGEYFTAAKVAQEKVGNRLGRFIVEQYRKNRVNLDKLTLIGQGIGAHIVGIAGKTVYNKLGKKVLRIIGVSPAGPGFHFGGQSRRLHKDDARCVAIIHTDQLIFGYKEPIGGLDFVANAGYYQPGCKLGFDLCSHHRAIEYLIEAIHKVPYRGVYNAPNDDPEDGTWNFLRMVSGNCSMEYRQYYFTTNSQPPYLRIKTKN